MTKQELKWFDALHNDRAKVAEVLLRPEFINVFNEAIDKYSESAHFLYELFQNADDAGATKAELILEKDKFIFKHKKTAVLFFKNIAVNFYLFSFQILRIF